MAILSSETVGEEAARSAVLAATRRALLDIRATDDIERARKRADVIHHVPTMIARKEAPERLEAELRQSAERLSIQGFVGGSLQHGLKAAGMTGGSRD